MGDIRTAEIDVGEWTLHTHEVGDARDPVIVWLHGSGPGSSAVSNWSALITTMPGFRHVAPDILGFGDSSHPTDLPRGVTATASVRAKATLGLLDALGIEKANLVGNSMGGMISLLLLQVAPERFDRAILMGSGGAPLTPTDDLIRMITYYQNPTAAGMLDLIGRFMHNTGLFGSTIHDIAENRAAIANRPDIRRSHEATFDPSESPLVFTEDELNAIRHEVLLVHGREDRIIDPASSLYLSQHLPNAQLHVLPHAGHWVQIEQADRFRDLATWFLREER